MGRNNQRNRHITVPFKRDGRTLTCLEADAERHNMLNFIGVLAGLRLGEYYEAIEEGRILPKGMVYNGNIIQMQQPSAMVPMVNGNGGHQSLVPIELTPSINSAELDRLQERPNVIEESTETNDDDFSYFAEE